MQDLCCRSDQDGASLIGVHAAYRAHALLIQVIHARSGVPHEIMGLMQGKVVGTSLVIIDSFALPVQGTETRVNAQNEANEYMVQYIQGSERVQRLENAVGWYHCHPGYGCWLSRIDVNTQMTNQKFQDPFVAVVVSIFDATELAVY